jgi:hypothetical protein
VHAHLFLLKAEQLGHSLHLHTIDSFEDVAQGGRRTYGIPQNTSSRHCFPYGTHILLLDDEDTGMKLYFFVVFARLRNLVWHLEELRESTNLYSTSVPTAGNNIKYIL